MTLHSFPPRGSRIPAPPTDRRANAPVIFPCKELAFDLWAVGALHRGERDFFGVALEALEAGRTELFSQALSGVRVHAQRIVFLVSELERKVAGDDFENSPNVYGEGQ